MVRLADDSSSEARAVKTLLSYRLKSSHDEARKEWMEILEGTSSLWTDIGESYRETIRSFLLVFNNEILRHSAAQFDWRGGSVGNFFFTGTRIFFNSLETAIWLFSRVSGIPKETEIIPIVSKNARFTLGAQLKDGAKLFGQNEISHPSLTNLRRKSEANLQQSVLHSPIDRIFYINDDGQETQPEPNPKLLAKIPIQQAIVYGNGSLYTSILPSLVLQVGF
jgi:cathepsin L